MLHEFKKALGGGGFFYWNQIGGKEMVSYSIFNQGSLTPHPHDHIVRALLSLSK